MEKRLTLVCVVFMLAGSGQGSSADDDFNPSRPTISRTETKLLKLDCDVPRSMTAGWESLQSLELQVKPRGCSERVSLAVISPELESPKSPNLPPLANVKGSTECSDFPFDCRLQVYSPFPSNFLGRGAYYCIATYNKTGGGTESVEFGVNVDQTFVDESQSHKDHIFEVAIEEAHKLVVAWNKSEWAGVTEASVVRLTLDMDGELAERPRSLFRVTGQQSIVYDDVGVVLAQRTPLSGSAQRRKRSAEDELDVVTESRDIEITQTVYVLKNGCHDRCPQKCYVCRYAFSCELNHPRCIGDDVKLCFCHGTAAVGGIPDYPGADKRRAAASEAREEEEVEWSAVRPLVVLMVFFLLFVLVLLLLCVLHRTGKLCGNKYMRELFCCPAVKGRYAHRRREVHGSPRSTDRDGGRSSESPGEEGRSFLPPATE